MKSVDAALCVLCALCGKKTSFRPIKTLIFRLNCDIMRCAFEDKATPKTGGVTNQCPQNRHITFQARNLKIRIPPDLSERIMQNEPNLPPQQPKNAKRTQSAPGQQPIAKSQSPKAKSCFYNEPNLRPERRNTKDYGLYAKDCF